MTVYRFALNLSEETSTWHVRLGETTCVNVGQAEVAFHYTVLDFEFEALVPSQPSKIIVRAFPWRQEIEL